MKGHNCSNLLGWSKTNSQWSLGHGHLPTRFIPSRNISINSAIAQGLRETSKLERTTSEARGRSSPKLTKFIRGPRQNSDNAEQEYRPIRTVATRDIGDDGLGFLYCDGQERMPRRSRGARHVKVYDDMRERKRETFRDDHEIPLAIPYATAASVMIPGMRPVQAAFRAKRRKLYKLWMNGDWARRPENIDLLDQAKAAKVTIELVSDNFLDSMKKQLTTAGLMGKDGVPFLHDGVMLDASPLPQTPLKSLGFYTAYGDFFDLDLEPQTKEEAEINGTACRLSYSSDGWRRPFLIWLHGVVDTRNLGAILRTALYFAADGVILTKRGTASVSDPGAQKASAGASEFLPVMTINSPTDFITASQTAGWHFYAAVAPPTESAPASYRVQTLDDLSYGPLHRHPCVLVFGNEDQGLPPSLVRMLDHKITISAPVPELVRRTGLDSLNVSVAAALLMEGFLRKPTGEHLELVKRLTDSPKLHPDRLGR